MSSGQSHCDSPSHPAGSPSLIVAEWARCSHVLEIMRDSDGGGGASKLEKAHKGINPGLQLLRPFFDLVLIKTF